MKKNILAIIVMILSVAFLIACTESKQGGEAVPEAEKEQRKFRFVMISKVVHPWFDQVEKGALIAAENLSAETGDIFEVEYRAPENADVVQQNEIIEQIIATNPDGIFHRFA